MVNTSPCLAGLITARIAVAEIQGTRDWSDETIEAFATITQRLYELIKEDMEATKTH